MPRMGRVVADGKQINLSPLFPEKVGGPYLDPFVQKAFDELNVPENEHANGVLYANCKVEATNLTNRALDLMHESWMSQLPR